ncbi:MAG: S9 family peptidase [Sinobacteraceae bacterium]|nr:S9 family peptidase [Nevskiaceae bacterium]
MPLLAHAGRPLQPEDWYRFAAVSDLQIESDGTAVAYLVTRYDKDADESRAELWTASWDGAQSVQLTRGESAGAPRFSPDGRYLTFLSTRPANSGQQLWMLDRRGGEARQISHESGEIEDYEWSPDGVHIVLTERSSRVKPAEQGHAESAPPRPLVIDDLRFKQDKQGYLTANSRTHLYLLDTRTGSSEVLTHEADREESAPAFSPDGKQIAYVSQKFGAAELGHDELELLDSHGGAVPRTLLSILTPNKQKLAWSPDGGTLAYLQGDVPRFNAYIMDRLAVVQLGSGATRDLTGQLDRAVSAPQFSDGGESLIFTVEDDGYQYPARIAAGGGPVTHLAEGLVVHELSSARGHVAVVVSDDHAPAEVYALESGKLRALSAHNRELFHEITLGSVEDIAFGVHGGVQVHGMIVKPPGYTAGRRYPTLLWIHGGPNGQDSHALELWGYGPELERQYFATHGYVVLAVNYRGSTGRGAQYARAIAADWGHKEVEDLLAAADYAVARGIAERSQLGLGGWSYGGILTDYTIASDRRFKAAISGAGSGNQTAMYGVDQYILQYNAELGPPWVNQGRWLQVSYPFFHADRIHTPTLFLGGDHDFNVPLAGGEQMYEALRTLGVPTELIIYPGEYHVLTRPSFLVDRTQRYLDWMQRYLPAAH